MVLSDQGKRIVLKYNLDEMKIKIPKKWDGKWRIVMFDVPESRRILRDAFRFHLKNMGFHEFQKSVFIHPHQCKSELEFLIEYYDCRKYVRQLTVDEVDNDIHLKKIFKLS
jgi:DNA-binding transcriptional regulator PaaX